MGETKALTPSAERIVDFYGDPIMVALLPNDEVYVPLKPIVDYLGLDWGGQHQRFLRDDLLVRRSALVQVSAADGRTREMLCLPLDLVPGWLFGISPRRVRPELAQKLERYREECFRVLWHAFRPETLATFDDDDLVTDTPVSESTGSLLQIRAMGLAIVQMAEQQLALEQRVTTHDERLRRAAQLFRQFEHRLSDMEGQLQPGATISPAEATALSARVKALAELMSSKQPHTNHYQGIFAELYRRYGVSSYKHIARAQYEDAMRFLEDYRQAVLEAPST